MLLSSAGPEGGPAALRSPSAFPHEEHTGRGRDASGRGQVSTPHTPMSSFVLDTGSESLARGGSPRTCSHQRPSDRGHSAQWVGWQLADDSCAGSTWGGRWGRRSREGGCCSQVTTGRSPRGWGPVPKEAEASATGQGREKPAVPGPAPSPDAANSCSLPIVTGSPGHPPTCQAVTLPMR